MENILNPEILIHTLGYAGIFGTVFLESGFFFAFFLPGDTLLFSTGFLASTGVLDYGLSLFGVMFASFLGSLAGYFFGKKIGGKIFFKKNSLFFDPQNLERTKKFFEKYGTFAVFFARFVPVVRTFAPILAGVGGMHYGKFLKYNFFGSIAWPLVVISSGYFLGNQFPQIHQYVMPVVIGVFVFAFFASIFSVFLKKKK